MESVFSRFESYDFAADQRFQDGLKTLRGSAEGDKLRDMKLFFYNRCGSESDPRERCCTFVLKLNLKIEKYKMSVLT